MKQNLAGKHGDLPYDGYYGHGYNYPGHFPYAQGYGYGGYGMPFGHFGAPYGYTGHLPKETAEDLDVSIDSVGRKSLSPRSRQLNYVTDRTVQLTVDSPKGKKKNEYVLKKVDKREEVQARRMAYDAHLKADILATGRNTSMNKTYDPYFHVDPRIVPYVAPYNGYHHRGTVPYVPHAYNADLDSQK